MGCVKTGFDSRRPDKFQFLLRENRTSSGSSGRERSALSLRFRAKQSKLRELLAKQKLPPSAFWTGKGVGGREVPRGGNPRTAGFSGARWSERHFRAARQTPALLS